MMSKLLDAAKELSMGEITDHEFLEILDINSKDFAQAISNYHYELMRQWKVSELTASLRNIGYLIENYLEVEKAEGE